MPSGCFTCIAPPFNVGEFLQGLSNLLQRRNFAEALHESAGTPGPVARVIHAAIIRHDAPRAELKEIVQEAGQLEVPKLERFLGVLATLAYVAPLLGLLGTVAGMIDAFGTLSSNGGYATVTELSSGVYKSLLTTAAGLVVATPTFVAYSYLSSRVNSLMHEMERAGIEVVHMLTDREPSRRHHHLSGACGRTRSALVFRPGGRCRMKLSRTKDYQFSWLAAIPLLDVIFLLIFFLVLSSNFILQPGISVSVPLSRFTLGPQINPQIISITGGAAPAIYFRDQKVALDQLGPLLDEAKKEGRPIIIKADRLTPYALVVEVTNLALERGITSVALATTPARNECCPTPPPTI